MMLIDDIQFDFLATIPCSEPYNETSLNGVKKHQRKHVQFVLLVAGFLRNIKR